MAKTTVSASRIRLKRAYVAAEPEDGARVLVDRLWPRGVSKEKAAIDEWLKDLGPTTELRKWFGHDPARWEGFQTRYREELRDRAEALDHLRDLARRGTLTLVYGARDEIHNEAVILRDVLLDRAPAPP